MRFTPKTEEEILFDQLLPKGEYMFNVKHAEEAISKKGNEMIKLSISVWDNDGRDHTLYDYLLESMPYKLRHFCEVAQMIEKYQKGEVNAQDCINKEGVLLLDVEQGSPKPDGGNYPAKNVIKDYVKSAIQVSDPKPKITDSLNDDIPF